MRNEKTANNNKRGEDAKPVRKTLICALFGMFVGCAAIGCVYFAGNVLTTRGDIACGVKKQNAAAFYDQKAMFETLDSRIIEIRAAPTQASWAVHVAIESGDAAYMHEKTLAARAAYAQSAERLKSLPRDDMIDAELYRMIYGKGGCVALYAEYARLMEASYADAQMWLEKGSVGNMRCARFEDADRKLAEAETAWAKAENYASGHPYAKN
jgi:hypothetical protein